jgi:hypothetical protein
MAFTSLSDALAQLNLKEAELRKLVQEKGFQVFMSGQDDKGKKVICFKEEDIHVLAQELRLDGGDSTIFDMTPKHSLAPKDLEVEAASLELGDSMGGAEFDLSEDLEVSLDQEDAPEDMDLGAVGSGMDIELELDGSEADMVLPSDSASIDLDLGLDPDESLSLDLDSADSTLDVVPHAEEAQLDFDDTLAIDGGGLSFDPEADETLSIGDDDATLEFESEHLVLPNESFSLDEGETLTEDDKLELEESANLAIDEDESSVGGGGIRPTTEIIDEDNVNVFFAIFAFLCFGVIIFNGCLLFGLVQDMDLNGGISYGQNFFASVRDFTVSKFNLPN